MKNKRLILIQAGVVALLLIPLIAMQFTKEVDWNIFDFVIMGILLSGTGFLCEFVLRKAKSTQSRILICALVIVLFLLTWIELAVGIFGTPFAGS
jgi:dipeptide/tripeptide permease